LIGPLIWEIFNLADKFGSVASVRVDDPFAESSISSDTRCLAQEAAISAARGYCARRPSGPAYRECINWTRAYL